MKHIVILGNSAAGVTIIEELRRTDTSSQITLISLDGHYPYHRDAFAAFIAKEIAPEKVFCRSKDFYEQHQVSLILDKKISRINLKRKKIFTEDKTQIDYDVLVVTDTPENRYPEIRGTNKTCVYGYKKLKDIDQLTGALPVIRTAVVQSDSFSGFQAAISFVKRGKEAILVTSQNGFLNRHFSSEASAWLMEKIEEKGLRIMPDNGVAEILGDKDAKAVRLKTGKVFSAEAVIFAEMNEDLRLFSDSISKIGRGIGVNEKFQADADQVFAVDQVCNLSGPEPVAPLVVLEEQGRVVANTINGQESSFVMPLCVRTQDVEGIVITLLGEIDGDGLEIQETFDSESGDFQRFYLKDHCLVGAALINQEDEKEELLEKIRKKTCVEPQSVQEQGENTLLEKACVSQQMDEGNVSIEVVDKQ